MTNDLAGRVRSRSEPFVNVSEPPDQWLHKEMHFSACLLNGGPPAAASPFAFALGLLPSLTSLKAFLQCDAQLYPPSGYFPPLTSSPGVKVPVMH